MAILSDEQIIKLGKQPRVVDAKIVDAASVKTAEWVRLKCQYGCGGYGRCLTCPPYSPTPRQTQRMLHGYRRGLLIHARATKTIRAAAPKIERELFLAGYYAAFAFSCGPCSLCEECDVTGLCEHPEQARPAMEACGIDVFATARNNGFPIEVVSSYEQRQNYYGLVMFE
jgi:predicted metal-binding protein